MGKKDEPKYKRFWFPLRRPRGWRMKFLDRWLTREEKEAVTRSLVRLYHDDQRFNSLVYLFANILRKYEGVNTMGVIAAIDAADKAIREAQRYGMDRSSEAAERQTENRLIDGSNVLVSPELLSVARHLVKWFSPDGDEAPCGDFIRPTEALMALRVAQAFLREESHAEGTLWGRIQRPIPEGQKEE